MRDRNFVLLFVLIPLLAGFVVGQANITGTIVGTVTDASGAVVPNAKITVTNTDQNVVTRTVQTDSSGAYSAPLLPVGHYDVTAEAPGFTKAQQTGVTLNVNDRLTVPLQLQVGATQQTVTVEASPIQVNLVTPTAGELITGTQIRELTLTNRNYMQLLTLSPGVSSTTAENLYVGTTNPETGGTNVIGFQVNGQRTSANNWTIDGADNVDRGSNLTLLSTPSVDSIQEFKLLRSNYDAEYGRAAGGQVQVLTRSGTSAIHGSAYEFWRNENLNADSFFNKQRRFLPTTAQCARFQAAGNAQDCDTRTPLRYHNFGYTVGGPIWPGKTFFFFSEEFRRVITYSTQIATIPTAAELTGAFTNPVCIAWSGTTCTATGTRVANIVPTAAAYIKDIFSQVPNSTSAATHSFTDVFRSRNNFRQEAIKVDQNLGQKLNVYARYTHDSVPTEEPTGLFTSPPTVLRGVGNTSTNSPGWTLAGHATAIMSPTFLIDGGYNFSYGAIISDPTGLLASKNSPDIKPTLPFTPTLARVPTISFSDFMSPLASFGPYRDFNRNHQVFGNWTKVMGRHNLKFGGTYYHYQKTENAGGNNVGTFTFDASGAPATTASVRAQQAWANFLTGHVLSFTQASLDLTPDIQANQFEIYGQDEWRMGNTFTVSYGLRYSVFRQPTDANGFLTTFDPRFFNPAAAFQINPTTGNRVPGTGNPLNGIIPTSSAIAKCHSLPAGTTGFPCWPANTAAPYGNKVGNEDMFDLGPRVGIVWDPFGNGRTAVRSGFGIFYDVGLFGIVEQNIFDNPPFVNNVSISNTNFENPGAVLPNISAAAGVVDARVGAPWRNPRSYQYSLDVQHQLMNSWVMDVGYFGNVGRNLLGIFELNQPQVGQYLAAGLSSPTDPTCASFGGGPCITSARVNVLNAVRPYPGYASVRAIRPVFDSNYNSLQVSSQKRFAAGSLWGVAYTWSHALTDNQTDRSSAPQNTYDQHGDYGPTQQDRRHIFTTNYVYELPFFRNQRGVLGRILGGWETTGIITAQSGTPLTIGALSSVVPDRAGQGCQLSSTPCALRPDLVGDPNSNAPHTFAQWFNTSAFSPVPAGQVRPGNSRRGDILGPGFWRADLSAMKNIRFTERITSQFRLDAFNAFNHTSPLTIGSTSLGSSLLGVITQTRLPRTMSLGLKVYF
jgi:hypothetical protein